MKEYLEILRMAPWQKFYIQINFVTFYIKKTQTNTEKQTVFNFSKLDRPTVWKDLRKITITTFYPLFTLMLNLS